MEGSAGHGQQLAVALVDAGHDVREVPARRTAQRRRERRRAKTDREDALAIARATAGEPGLGPVRAGHRDPVLEELDAVNDWRDDLVEQRKRLLNQAEGILNKLPVELLDQIGRTGKTLTRARRASPLTTTAVPAVLMRRSHLADIVGRHDDLTARIKTVQADRQDRSRSPQGGS
ncbi:MAG: IS110 family transposase [Acidimicrobiales bacterium]